jgi:hypothetical protein
MRLLSQMSESELGETLDAAGVPLAERVAEWRGRTSELITPLRYWTPREIAAATSANVDWIVTGYVARQAITELDGRVKAAGKTTLALHLIRAVIEGDPFLDQPTAQSKVIYLTEQQPGPFRDALDRAGLLEYGDECRILYRRDVATRPWADLMATIAADAAREGYGLLVVDTLGKLAGLRDENDAAEAGRAMAPLQDAAHDGLAVLVLRHERKGGGAVGESARGSSAFGGDVDVILQLRRPDGNQPRTRRVIESLSRYGETPEKVITELLPEGYVLLGEEEAVVLGDAVRILSALLGREVWAETDGPTLDELVGASELARTTVQRAVRHLDSLGQVIVTGAGKKGDPKRYRLTSPSEKEDSAQTYGRIGAESISAPVEESEHTLLEQVAAWRFGTAPEPEPPEAA